MQHEGSFHLDDIRRLKDDEALCEVLELGVLPSATTLGDWLRRMGKAPNIDGAWVAVNRPVLQSALPHCKRVTLDTDATEIVSHKSSATWTYNKNKGFMPMVGHIAQTGQIVAVDFRQGNIPPNKDNLAFIKQCQQSLPAGVTLVGYALIQPVIKPALFSIAMSKTLIMRFERKAVRRCANKLRL